MLNYIIFIIIILILLIPFGLVIYKRFKRCDSKNDVLVVEKKI